MFKPQLLSMKQSGAAVKLTLSNTNTANFTLSEDYIIDKFVIVRFQCYANSRRCTGIAIKKHELVTDFTITAKVTCANEIVKTAEISCLQDWSEWVRISETNQTTIVVDLTITVRNMQSIIKNLYLDDTFTDFQLTAEDGSVPVHRALLAAHSDMFKTMLSGKWKETEEGRVELKGITRQALMYFKEYIYIGTFPDNDDDANTLCQLLLLAIRYLIDNLKLECLLKLMQKITAQNLNAVLEFAVENKVEELFNTIMERISENLFASTYQLKMKSLMYGKNDEEDEENEENEE